MSEQERPQQDPAEARKDAPAAGPAEYGHLSVEDDETGTVNPADLAGTAGPDDADVGYSPSSSEADPGEASAR